MKSLQDLLASLTSKEIFGNTTGRLVSSVSDDSRKISKDSLFVAIRGIKHDGHKYIDSVIAAGAACVVGEINPDPNWLKNICYVKVPDSRVALGLVASAWFDYPSKKMKIVGVTGTDGKTTTSTIIYSILKTAGKRVGLVSTVSAKIGDKEYDTGFHVTNPEPIALQEFLSLMVDEGCEYAVLEVTSHGLDQERVAGVGFDVSVLTNVTNEHLDYHKTYENYLETKAKLFLRSKISILNKDDNSFEKMNMIINSKTQVFGYSINDLNGVLKDVIFARFPEGYNRSNATAAITTVKQLGVGDESIIQTIKEFKGIKGRLQEVENDKGLKIYIDYAHTPNAVEKVLAALSTKKTGKIISIVTAEGERDPGKRIGIPAASVRIADITILNPIDFRSEDPNEILEQMEKGAQDAGGIKGETFFGVIDRQEAIDLAINKLAEGGDTVVICGKGHETGMDFGDHEEPWSDQEAVSRTLSKN